MLETLRNAFKIKDIRNRIIFTFLMLVAVSYTHLDVYKRQAWKKQGRFLPVHNGDPGRDKRRLLPVFEENNKKLENREKFYLLLPVSYTHLYGMNVNEKWMPFANTPHGFLIICIITLLILSLIHICCVIPFSSINKSTRSS